MKKNISLKTKIFFLIIFIFSITLIISGCDKTLFDIYTQINSDYSGVRTIDIAVKTEYIKRGEVSVGGEKSLFDKIFALLPQGEINTFEKDNYTHFVSKIYFKDINFLQHVSIDNFSEDPSERFYAKIEKKDSFFYTQYYYLDYVDMKIDDAVIKSGGANSDFARLDNILKSDKDIISITYQVKFPFKIIKSNADVIGSSNIAIWNLSYGEQKLVSVEGKKIKFLPYFLLIILGIIILFILFLIFAIILTSTRRKFEIKRSKPIYSYDNYFKKNKKDRY
ncbi:MAG: hypothetical protein M1475_04745 [Actinobacteria bacterium]|nr:hypothetical protein [Actinomycetota bacterium]